MLVVDDILIANFVLPFARGLGEHTLNGVYDWLDDQGVRLGRRLLRRLTKGRMGTGDVEHLVSDLGAYVEQHPEAASRLTAAALRDAGALAKTDKEFLDVLLSFLMAVFELVKKLDQPAVLPGFLTGTEHLAVIDVRTRNAGEEFAKPAIYSPQNDVPRIVLANRIMLYSLAENPLPRIWLVPAAPGERRKFEQHAKASKQCLSWPDDFVNSMKGQLLVTDITRREVWVQQPQIAPTGLFAPKGGTTHAFKWAESPAGVIEMHNVLVAAVEVKDAEKEVWVRAWTKALSERPNSA
jgi:hypothetical protein